MNNTTETIRKQALRGQVLTLCGEAESVGAGISIIYKLLNKEGFFCTKRDVEEACRYLQDKELIRFENVRSEELDIERDIAYITAEGTDILEGAEPVTGITFESEGV